MPDAVSIKTFFLRHQLSINDYLWDAIDESDRDHVDILETKAVAALVKDMEENHGCELKEIHEGYGNYKEKFDTIEEMLYGGVEWYVDEYDMKPSACKG